MLTSGVFGYLADYMLWWVLYLSLVLHTWCFFKMTAKWAGAEQAPSRARSVTRLMGGNVLITLCAVGALALAGESYYRFVAVETDAFGMSLPARRWFALYTKLNTLGCRDKEWSMEKPAGVHRIAFVGDSFTFGWGIKDPSDRFTSLIQKRFDAATPGRVEVFNVAKPGWGTDDQIQPVIDMVRLYDVDEVVLAYLPNDIEHILPTTDDFNPTEPPESTFFDPDRSCLLDHLYRRIIIPRKPSVRSYHDWLADGYANEEIWHKQQRSLNEIIMTCKDNGVQIRVALLPFLVTGGEKFDTENLHALLTHFFNVNNVPVVDLYPCIKNQDITKLMVSPHDPHPNETAHALFAARLWERMFAPQLRQ